jgi:hypothetical protein
VGQGGQWVVQNASGNFTITGFVAPTLDGTILVVYNKSTFNLTINNEDAGSSALNRILTMTGGPVSTTGEGNIVLVYCSNTSAGAARWIRIATAG